MGTTLVPKWELKKVPNMVSISRFLVPNVVPPKNAIKKTIFVVLITNCNNNCKYYYY